MANELDERTGPVNGAGRDVNVIERQLPVRVGWGSALFEIVLWCLGVLPGLIFLFMKIGAQNYFQKLQQKIQADASTIDNYLEQRVQILKNLAKLVEQAVDLDKDVMKAVAEGCPTASATPSPARSTAASGVSSRRSRRTQTSRRTPRSRMPSSRTAISRRRSPPRASCTTTPSCSGMPMSSTGRRSRSSRRAPATRRASRFPRRPRSRPRRGEPSFDRGRL